MSESISNVEFAHRVHEQGHHHGPPPGRRALWIGIAEAVVLFIVAVATAWRGYQTAAIIVNWSDPKEGPPQAGLSGGKNI